MAGVGLLTIPNLLTLSRLVLAPVFLWLYATGETGRALGVFAVAVATDLRDGLAARALGQHSRVGAFLDPIADKFLLACALFALAARSQLPMWLPVLVVSRDAALLAGAFVLRGTRHRVPVTPTRVGKYATLTLSATAVFALSAELGALEPPRAARLVAAMGMVAAQCVALSGAQYFLYFVRSLRTPPAEGEGAAGARADAR